MCLLLCMYMRSSQVSPPHAAAMYDWMEVTCPVASVTNSQCHRYAIFTDGEPIARTSGALRVFAYCTPKETFNTGCPSSCLLFLLLHFPSSYYCSYSCCFVILVLLVLRVIMVRFLFLFCVLLVCLLFFLLVFFLFLCVLFMLLLLLSLLLFILLCFMFFLFCWFILLFSDYCYLLLFFLFCY